MESSILDETSSGLWTLRFVSTAATIPADPFSAPPIFSLFNRCGKEVSILDL